MDLKGREDRLVFVDPEDEEISYWWPAIVVPEEEYELFKETMDNDAGVNVGNHERLVCYFEDGSFSIVPKSGLIPFNPQREPYKSYSTRLKHFLTDAGVKRATEYHNTGQIPKMFKWLILGETGYLDPAEIESEEEEEEEEVELGEDRSVKNVSRYVSNITTLDNETIVEKKHKKESTDHKKRKHHHKDHKDKKKHHIPSKRGRKPKPSESSAPSDNNTNDSLSLSIDPLVSPTTINPLDRMKIEALISSNSTDVVI